MQDRYVGDVGDFGKYGLLRHLCNQDPTLKLGVVWFRVPCESHNADGKHISYLQKPHAYRSCDPELFDSLRSLMHRCSGPTPSYKRELSLVEEADILPETTTFHSEPLSFPQDSTQDRRSRLREAWLQSALDQTRHADIIFLDPDNGIECKSVTRTNSKGPKYAFWDEIKAFADRGQSVVVYHHLNRTASTEEQIAKMQTTLKGSLPEGFENDAIVFTRGTRRAYFIAAAPPHAAIIRSALSEFARSLWHEHFFSLGSGQELQ